MTPRKQPLEVLRDDGIELGPAMRALSTRHRAVVYSLFDCGGNRTEAMRRNGYGRGDSYKAKKNLNSEASRFFSDRRIRAAIREQCEAQLAFIEPELLANITSIANNKREKTADRLRALSMIWDRSRPIESKHTIAVEHHVTNDERDVQHFLAMKKIGAPPDAFLRRFGANGMARVEALVAAEEARRRQLDGLVIDADCEAVDA
jgi:hypothetical protein